MAATGTELNLKLPAHLIIYDPKSKKVKLLLVKKDALSVESLVYSHGGVIGTVGLANGGQDLFKYLPKKKETKIITVVHGPNIQGLLTATDGGTYGYTSETIFRLNTITGMEVPLLTPEVDQSIRTAGIDAFTIDSDGVIWYGIKDTLKECSIIGFSRQPDR